MITDPIFYAAAIPAVIMIGLAKGGLGGAIGMLATPLVALVVPPVQAAGILLPILLAADAVAVWSWRHHVDWTLVRQTVPPSMVGIGIGWLAAAWVTPDQIRLIVGIVAFSFASRFWWDFFRRNEAAAQPTPRSRIRANFWCTVAGFTSFVIHAGGPPYQMYAVPLRLDKVNYVASTVHFFAIVNFAKLLPYYSLGQLSPTNLKTAAALLPIVPIATFTGIWLVNKINQEIFYRMIYAFILLVGARLTWTGLVAMF